MRRETYEYSVLFSNSVMSFVLLTFSAVFLFRVRGRVRVKVEVGGGFRVRVRVSASVRAR